MTPPVYAPPALHFLIADFSITCGTMQFTFWCKTDTLCYLTLHLSHQEPIIRRIPYQKRGADFELSSVTCFVEVATYEQIEPGDTLEHTFVVPLLAYCQQHYWYLTGTQGGVPCKSISQIFHVHCTKPSDPILTTDQNPYWNSNLMPYYTSAVGQRWTPDHDYAPVKLDLLLWQYSTRNKGYFKVQIREITGTYCWLEPILWEVTHYGPNLPTRYNHIYTTWPVTGFTALTTKAYRIVVYPILYWYYWTGSYWRRDNTAARIWWANYSPSPYYPRGYAMAGCNMYNNSLYWINAGSADMTFRLWEIPP